MHVDGARLNHFISRRLAVIKRTRAQLASFGGPSRSHLAKIITGERSMTPKFMASLDAALHWGAGSTERAATDGEPHPLELRDRISELLATASVLVEELLHHRHRIASAINETAKATKDYPQPGSSQAIRARLLEARSAAEHNERSAAELRTILQTAEEWMP